VLDLNPRHSHSLDSEEYSASSVAGPEKPTDLWPWAGGCPFSHQVDITLILFSGEYSALNRCLRTLGIRN
jgi:hypothetical protein